MKKTTRKLVLRKATVRELSSQALERAVGGVETDEVPYSRPRECLTSGLVAMNVPRDGG
jgi:hypothetical protein